MIVNGVDLSELKHEKKVFTPRPVVPGRVVHVDADFLAYQVSAGNKESLPEMKHNCEIIVEKMRLMAGAETAQLHLTPRGSDKGGRYDAAIIREYQATRKGKPKPQFLHVIREWMHQELGAKLHMECEADDGMSMAQYAAIERGERNLSVIATKDKDLCMCPGLALNWDTGELTEIEDPFGYIELIEGVDKNGKAKAKKLRGRGWKFFWAQMLMGDTADNISGLPKCYIQDYLPTGKPKACGPVLTYEILNPCATNKEAFLKVRDLFKAYDEAEGFFHWKTGDKVPFGLVLQSEARLLWMRRKPDLDDAIQWMKEHCV